MELTVITDNQELAKLLATADPTAKVKPSTSVGTLHADLSGAAVVAYTVKSVAAVAELAKTVWKKIEPALTSKPKGKLVIKGPFGEISVELANVTEKMLESLFRQVFEAAQHAPKTRKRTRTK